MLAEHLTQFCDLVALDQVVVREAEQVDRFGLATALNAAQLQPVRREDYEVLCQVFGPTITFRIKLNDVPFLEIEAGTVPVDIDSSLQELQRLPSTLLLDVELLINKTELVRLLNLQGDAFHTIFLLFTDRLTAILSADVVTQDRELFSAPYRPTLIVVSEATFAFSGHLLTSVASHHRTNSVNEKTPPVIISKIFINAAR